MTDTINGVTSAKSIRTDFLNLLAAQLSNQNPLEPMDNSDMTMQMATLAQLEQTENITSMFQKLVRSFDLVEATKLVGAKVTFFPTDQHGLPSDEAQSGIAMQVNIVDSEVTLRVNGHDVPLSDIIQVSSTDELTTKLDQLLERVSSPEQRTVIEQLLAEAESPEQQEQILLGMVDRIDYLPDDPTLKEFYNWLDTIPALQ